MKTVNWLLVGAGDIATRRAGPALDAVKCSEVLAVCSRSHERAAILAEQLKVKKVYLDYDQALAESGANAVYIATPQETHVEMSLKALQAGKHFLCEKPVGLNGAEGLRLLKAVRRSSLVASVSNYRRLSEQYKVTEDMLRRQEIGRLRGGWAVYSAPFYNPGNRRVFQANGSSRIKELCFYLIDIVHNVFGMPVGVATQASILDKVAMNDVEDIASIVMKFRGGELFTIVSNVGPVCRHELEFFGDQGSIYWQQWPPHGNGPVLKITPKGTQTVEARTDPNWHLPMIEDYVDALRNGRQPVCTVESAAKTEVITDAIFRAIASGKTETVSWEG